MRPKLSETGGVINNLKIHRSGFSILLPLSAVSSLAIVIVVLTARVMVFTVFRKEL